MKLLLFLLLVSMGYVPVSGQAVTKNSIRVGIGTHWPYLGEGSGMKGGLTFSSEYLRELKKRLYLSANIQYLTRHEGFKNEIHVNWAQNVLVPASLKGKRVQHESIVAGYVSVAWAPVNDLKNLLLIGGGAGIQYNAYTQFWTMSNPNGYMIMSGRRTSPSFNFLLGYDFKVTQHVSLGLRQNFLIDGEMIPLLSIGVGARF
ncbi:hypothetical protein GCM10027347_12030 [Larkinella harenae]